MNPIMPLIMVNPIMSLIMAVRKQEQRQIHEYMMNSALKMMSYHCGSSQFVGEVYLRSKIDLSTGGMYIQPQTACLYVQ